MMQRIDQTLCELEREHGVRILYAAESGSRAWGFASPDSDYDVRFVYVRPAADYLRLTAPRDVIEYMPDDVLDVSGWDLQKALRLLAKSNSTLFEWDNSPFVYRTTRAWCAVSSVLQRCFQSQAVLWHYLNTAQSNHRTLGKGDTVRLKKYLYILRPILACLWILERGTPPPMPFAELVEAQLDASVKPAVEQLLAAKTRSSELGMGMRIPVINEYIDTQLAALRSSIGQLPEGPQACRDDLDRIFFDIVMAENA